MSTHDKPSLIYRLHNWCNEDHGADIVEEAQELMSEAAEELTARSAERPTVGETPRTDALYKEYNATNFISNAELDAVYELARQLERDHTDLLNRELGFSEAVEAEVAKRCAPSSVADTEPVAWLYSYAKPGKRVEFASVDPNDTTEWPLDQWTDVKKQPLYLAASATRDTNPASQVPPTRGNDVRDTAGSLPVELPQPARAGLDKWLRDQPWHAPEHGGYKLYDADTVLAARMVAIEECAKVCDDYQREGESGHKAYEHETAAELAARIRARADRGNVSG